MVEDQKIIFLVEDDRFMAELLVEKFSRKGFKILHAADSKDAYKIIADKEKFDVVLLDLLLPGGEGGFEILRKLKQNTDTAKVPVLIISNLGSKEDIEQGFQLGASEYLVKAHVTLDEMLDKTREVMEKAAKSSKVG